MKSKHSRRLVPIRRSQKAFAWAPEQSESLSMPADQRLGLHNDQQLTPGEAARQAGKDDARRIIGARGLDLALLLQRQQFAEEQILRRELGT
jgi:hypothetical protein